MKRYLLTLGLGVLLGAVLLVGVLVARAFGFTSRQVPAEPAAPFATDTAAAAERLAGALRIPTISFSDTLAADGPEWAQMHAYLERSFPRVHAALRRETVGRHALLFTWPGTDPSLPPVLLAGHMDVVPVEPGTEAAWTHGPFAGEVADGFVWGRGAIDDKSGVLGILEAVEGLMAEGFRPRRTVLLAFGADEEVGGREGAARIAALLRARGVRPEWVVDEGGAVFQGMMPGLEAPVALVGVAEKGFVSVELVARGGGGHSSMPPRQTAVGILARAVSRLEENPLPSGIRGATGLLFDYAGPEMPFGMRLLFANRWLFGPLVERQLAAKPATDATLRTTTAATVFQGGTKDNVLPSQARAVVNFRILPGDSIAGVLEHVRRTVDDPRVEVRAKGFASEPSPVSSTESAGWKVLQRSIRQTFPDAVVAPYLVVGATDARYYAGLSESVYRFLPVRLTAADLARMHGTDERVGVADYATAVRFYAQLLRNGAG
ncbi:MAG TPA: M20 family peptidase [Longimicrobiaceae bacterium]|nr:M20 family peptidase [Longimicrobiaceae bacterium]